MSKDEEVPDKQFKLKYPKPKIMLVDMSEDAVERLKASGFNVTGGSFGTPFNIKKSDNIIPYHNQDKSLPNYSEQEIIVIDMADKSAVTLKDTIDFPVHGVDAVWMKCETGVIEPRPLFMAQTRENADRIFQHGGVFVVFTEARETVEMLWGHSQAYNNGLVDRTEITFTNWDFLNILGESVLSVTFDYGEEITVTSSQEPLHSLLVRHSRNATFSCTLKSAIHFPSDYKWVPLLKNKYGLTVGGAISDETNGGLVFLFPDLDDKPGFLDAFFNEVLPEFAPDLFPNVEEGRWRHHLDYELPIVVQYMTEIEEVQAEADKKVAALSVLIEEEQTQQGYLLDLLTQTGDVLVKAVQKALTTLGFTRIVNMDDENDKEGDTGNRREDLQILDHSPLLLVEIKGIANLPKESSALQVWKYIAPRMQQLNRTDIRGLSIINHQRNMPPLDRENRETFQADILINARHHLFSLMTTWDLYRLTRNFLKYQ